MIWIILHIFILLESGIHWFLIEICQLNPTPDKIGWENVLTVLFRSVCIYLIFFISDFQIQSLEFLMYALGALFSHLLWFPIVLNLMRGKDFWYLGENGIDGLVNKITFGFWPARIIWLIILSAGFIYGYYNTNLL